MLREVLAPNPSPMTLAGTRTWIVGERRVALIDPGPAIDAHVEAVADAIAGAESVAILLTHDHPDHADAAPAMAARFGASVRAASREMLSEQDRIETDAGALIALATPGHAPDHFAFHWPDARAVFCGDLMMGGLDTALIAPPEGNLREYLASLERIRALRPDRIIPAHGPPINDADAAIARYIRHRRARCGQVADALANAPPLNTREVADRVYGGEVPGDLREVAVAAVVAYLEYLEEDGTVERADGLWRRTG
jgi:glyoxylase-like metal-dependent hydrolase (beta-lactamase superfamily II)